MNHGVSIKYKEVYEALVKEIRSGQYMTGSFLPSELQLMEQYQVSRTTVRKAMSLLQENGLVKISQGRGTEVVEGKTPVTERDTKVQYHLLHMTEIFLNEGIRETSGSVIDVIQADSKLANNLKIDPLSDVYRIQRMKYSGNVPYDYIVSYVPCDIAFGLEKYTGKAFRLKRCLQEEFGLQYCQSQEFYQAVNANFTKANFLHVAVGDPLMVVCHTGFGQERIIEYTESFTRTDIYQKGIVFGDGIGGAADSDYDNKVI